MLVFARAATTWIIPTLAIFIFGNSCGKGWLALWMQCADALTQKMDVQGPSATIESAEGNPVCYTNSGNIPYGKLFLKPTNIITGKTICHKDADILPDYSECPRSIIDAMAPLLVIKLANTTLLLPAITLFLWHLAPGGWGPVMKRMTSRVIKKDLSFFKEFRELYLDDVLAQYITWMQVGLIFGPHAPVILPMLLVCFVTHRWVHEQGLRHFGKVEAHVQDGEGCAPTKHIIYAVVCQQGLSACLFMGSNLAGKHVVLVAAVCTGVAVTTILFLPARKLRIFEAHHDCWLRCCRKRLRLRWARRWIPWVIEDIQGINQPYNSNDSNNNAVVVPLDASPSPADPMQSPEQSAPEPEKQNETVSPIYLYHEERRRSSANAAASTALATVKVRSAEEDAKLGL